jgi:hypothetical protein
MGNAMQLGLLCVLTASVALAGDQPSIVKGTVTKVADRVITITGDEGAEQIVVIQVGDKITVTRDTPVLTELGAADVAFLQKDLQLLDADIEAIKDLDIEVRQDVLHWTAKRDRAALGAFKVSRDFFRAQMATTEFADLVTPKEWRSKYLTKDERTQLTKHVRDSFK